MEKKISAQFEVMSNKMSESGELEALVVSQGEKIESPNADSKPERYAGGMRLRSQNRVDYK